MSIVVNIEQCFDKFSDTYSPKIVGELNGQLVMVVRCEGDKVPWHTHEKEDAMFYVLEGVLEVQDRAKSVMVRAGEFTIVKSGIEHRVVPQGHVKLMLFEPDNIEHTGKANSEISLKKFDHLEL